jgi:hypothetical protein
MYSKHRSKKRNVNAILEVKNKLIEYYSSIYFIKGKDKPKPISPTDTLLSKIMLGTLGCIPAYDRYFIEGLKEKKMKHTGFNVDSLHELFNFIDDNREEITASQELIKTKIQKHYPLMKILDMYFWQTGYDLQKQKS